MSESADAAGPVNLQNLPPVRSSCAPAEVMRRLETMSKRGRLPGFRKDSPTRFTATLFGHPFDYELRGEIEPADGASRIVLTAGILWKMPLIFVLVCAFTVWPGVWLTDRLIPGTWNWIATWIWYLPLTVLPLPWMWMKWWRGSRAAAAESAGELAARIAGEFAGGGPP